MFFSVLMCSVEINPKFLEALAPKTRGVKSWKYVSSSSSSTIFIFNKLHHLLSYHCNCQFSQCNCQSHTVTNRVEGAMNLPRSVKKGGFCLSVCMTYSVCHENPDLQLFSSLFAQEDDTCARRYRSSSLVTWLQRLKEGQERRRSRGAKCLQLEIRRGPILPVNHISKPLSVVIAFWTEQCFCQHGDTRNKKEMLR